MYIRSMTALNGSALAPEQMAIRTRSFLDQLAADFRHTEAGEPLGVTRDQSCRMVEQKTAYIANVNSGPL
jgi:hypothetical protein